MIDPIANILEGPSDTMRRCLASNLFSQIFTTPALIVTWYIMTKLMHGHLGRLFNTNSSYAVLCSTIWSFQPPRPGHRLANSGPGSCMAEVRFASSRAIL